jgi:hypothetical protein
VEIMESRPLSKTKHWRLVRVVSKARVALPQTEVEQLGASPV